MIDPAKYENGQSVGDNDSLYSGYSNDLHRFAGNVGNATPWMPPLKDGIETVVDPFGYLRFGSAHTGGSNMAYCDGSVQYLSFDIDAEVHFRAGHRRDRGAPVDELW